MFIDSGDKNTNVFDIINKSKDVVKSTNDGVDEYASNEGYTPVERDPRELNVLDAINSDLTKPVDGEDPLTRLRKLEISARQSGGSTPVVPKKVAVVNGVECDTLEEALSVINPGDTIVLQCNTQLADNLVVNKEDVSLDLNGNQIVGNGSNGAINVESGSIKLTGDGVVEGTLGSDNYSMAVWAKGNLVIDGGTYKNATDGSERGTDLIYASGNSLVEINGGFFEAAKPEWTLNCKDADYKAGKCNIVVKGGTFVNFDPSNNATEGPETNYVAEGYTVVSETKENGDIWYTVVPE